MRLVKVNMNYIFQLIQSIDLYGTKIDINFQRQPVYKTLFGGLLTMGILILFILSCWFYGQELIVREKPSVISSDRYVDKAARISVQNDNLIAMIGVQDGESSGFIDPTIFSIRAVQEQLHSYTDPQTGQQKKRLMRKEHQMKQCNAQQDVKIPSLESYFSQIDANSMYCFNNESDLYMEGDFDSSAFAQIIVYIDKCKNITNTIDSQQPQVICQSSEQINAKLKLTKLSMYLSDKLIDPSDYQAPFKDKGINLYSPTSSSFPKELQVFFTNVYIENDIGFLYKQTETIQNFVFQDMKETSYFSDENTLVRVVFRLQKMREKLIQRRYLKIAEIIAQIGGLLKIFTTLGFVVCFPFAKLSLNKAIVDEVFNFEQEEEEKGSIKLEDQQILTKHPLISSATETQAQKRESLSGLASPALKQVPLSPAVISSKLTEEQTKRESNNLKSDSPIHNTTSDIKLKSRRDTLHFEFQNTFSSNMIRSKQKRRSFLEAAKEIFSVTRQTISYSFLSNFFHIFFPNSKRIASKRSQVNVGITKITDHLDVLFILNKLLEVDKLKAVLLDEDQLKLFEYIPRPVIPTTENSLNQIPSSQEKIKINTLHEIAEQKMSPRQESSERGLTEIENERQKRRLQVLSQTSKRIYQSTYGIKKTDVEKAIDAYQGLVNIYRKNKRSSKDDKLIELIDPSILEEFHRGKKQTAEQIGINNLRKSRMATLKTSKTYKTLSQDNQVKSIIVQQQTLEQFNELPIESLSKEVSSSLNDENQNYEDIDMNNYQFSEQMDSGNLANEIPSQSFQRKITSQIIV